MLQKVTLHSRSVKYRNFFTVTRGVKDLVYDVIVVGGGHAGCESAAAAARCGAKTLLVTHSKSTIGEMSCSPSFGGVGKGHLVREVDALDGVCGRMCDEAAITYQVLNRSRGPAVLGLRAQIDRKLYKRAMQNEILNTPKLDVWEASVEDLIVESNVNGNLKRITGCIFADGKIVSAKAVVITTGTFLKGEMFFGLNRIKGGRVNENASYGLAETFRNRLGLNCGRLRTGTPPRLIGSSIDFSYFQELFPDEVPIPFSFLTKEVRFKPKDQVSTYLGYTNDDVAKLVMDSLENNDHIKQDVTGPRSCPSLEAKVLRFPHLKHRFFLEPEGLDSDLIYPGGIGISCDADNQLKILRAIPGLKNVEIAACGYGVQYDYVNPQQLKRSLEVKNVDGLFLAGQINGTTGYEEAAAQGIIAGINAGRKCKQEDFFEPDRTQGYIGVLIDDLTTLGTNEPYRMYTSRVEFRLHLRPDNADFRLTELGFKYGAVCSERYEHFQKIRDRFTSCKERLEFLEYSITKWNQILPNLHATEKPKAFNGFELIARFYNSVSIDHLAQAMPNLFHEFEGDYELENRIKAAARYDDQKCNIDADLLRKEESVLIPSNLNYWSFNDLSLENREKLDQLKPQNLAAASRNKPIFMPSSVSVCVEPSSLPSHKRVSNEASQPQRTSIFKDIRLSINIVIGSIIIITILTSLGLFVFVPQWHHSPHFKQIMFPNNEHRRYDWPPPSYSLMGKFRRAAVTSDHGICSEIGRNILLRKGNAIEASIASLVCLGITNPQSSGIGGGFIMTFYNRTTKMCKVIDARETAPKASSRDMYGSDEWASKYGYKAIATPGELAGYWYAFTHFGSGNIKWSELILPSVDLARTGVPVSEYLAHVLSVKEKHFRTLPSMSSWINNATDHVYQFGDIIKRPELADTLEKIANAKNPVELFYHGEMADTIIAEIQANGGILTKEDLMEYRPKIYETPLISELPMGGYENEDNRTTSFRACGPPPPSSFAVTQSIISVMIARFSDHIREGNLFNKTTVLDDTEFYHWIIEAQKFAYAYRTQLGDIDFVPNSLKIARNMTTHSFIKWILSRVPKKAQPSSYYSTDNSYQKEDHGTSHVSVMDSEGNGVSATSTVNRWFGAVVQSEKYGIVWNDEMDDFSTPGMDNGFGFSPSEANFIAPGKRPMSSMSPMVIFEQRSGDVKLVIGASGGSKIISAIAKPVVRVFCFNETIKEAIDAPTFHNQFTPNITQYEEKIPKELLKDLETKFGQQFKPSTGFEGIVQAIYMGDDGNLYANGDYRRRSSIHPAGF